MLVRSSFDKETQRLGNPVACHRRVQIPTLVSDTHRAEPEARSGDAAGCRGIRRVQTGPVPHEPGLRICLLIEIRAGSAFDLIQQAVRSAGFLGTQKRSSRAGCQSAQKNPPIYTAHRPYTFMLIADTLLE